jgi:hypothetical protein
MITKVRIEDAVGLTLAHDVTKVLPGSFKGPAFRRGHIIKKEDVPEFLKIGKEHVFILRLEEGEVHEEEAALRIAKALMGSGLAYSNPSEGRVDLSATQAGLIKLNVGALDRINSLGEIIIATIHDRTVCNKGMAVAGTRIIPLCIREEKLAVMEQIAQENKPVISLAPFRLSKIGLIVTGNEVYKGLIEDKFTPVILSKVEKLGGTLNNQVIVPDDSGLISRMILDFQAMGSEVILCSSGMSVDPDDVTPEGIAKSGAKVHFYGLPVLPGAMFMYAKLSSTHILGVPACVLHSPATAFDKIFPILLAGEDLTFENTRKLGHGGLCLRCPQCNYPVCPFCK